MFPGFHGFDLMLFLVLVLFIVGPKTLPEVGAALGKSMQEDRKGMKEVAEAHLADKEAQIVPTRTGGVLQVMSAEEERGKER